MSEIPIHYVCTLEQARKLVGDRPQYWVTDCGCREGGKCRRSRHDVCLFWVPEDPGSGPNKKVVTRAAVEEILKLAATAPLVCRPFRNEARDNTVGICFCCDCCCGYFQPGNSYDCDKGEQIEVTAMTDCTHCGECVPVCYFGARKMQDGKLVLDREKCFGCGICVDFCPVGCLALKSRP